MKLIIGLGNPGKEYETTRHNVGFLSLNYIANSLGISFKTESKFQGDLALYNVNGEKVYFLKPLTYMNLSGDSIIKVMNFYKIDKKDILVIYDDMDLPFGHLRLRASGSAGGHNGIKSIIANVGGQDFKRIRVGISSHDNIDAKDYVLGKFSKADLNALAELSEYTMKAVMEFIEERPFERIMCDYNGKKI